MRCTGTSGSRCGHIWTHAVRGCCQAAVVRSRHALRGQTMMLHLERAQSVVFEVTDCRGFPDGHDRTVCSTLACLHLVWHTIGRMLMPNRGQTARSRAAASPAFCMPICRPQMAPCVARGVGSITKMMSMDSTLSKATEASIPHQMLRVTVSLHVGGGVLLTLSRLSTWLTGIHAFDPDGGDCMQALSPHDNA